MRSAEGIASGRTWLATTLGVKMRHVGSALSQSKHKERVEKFNECADWGGVSALKAARAVEIVSTLERAKGVAALMDSVVR